MPYQLIRTPFYRYMTSYDICHGELLKGPWRLVIGLAPNLDPAKPVWCIYRSWNAILVKMFGRGILAVGFKADDLSEMEYVDPRCLSTASPSSSAFPTNRSA